MEHPEDLGGCFQMRLAAKVVIVTKIEVVDEFEVGLETGFELGFEVEAEDRAAEIVQNEVVAERFEGLP